MQQTNAVILKAIALIENPEAWTQGVSARDLEGASVASNSQRACRWCTLGALDKAADDDNSWLAATREVRDVMMREEKFYRSVADFNDTHTHAEVLALLRKAAA
jgi:hypothetical protein